MKYLCKLDDLPASGSMSLKVADGKFDKELFVVVRDDEFFVYQNQCPHTGGPLDWQPGEFLNLDKTHIQCSTHYALFNIDDGVCVSGPCSGQSLIPVAVTVRDGNVMILEGE